MNPNYFGDSYDIVKRFFVGVLKSLGYAVFVDPMPTGNWMQSEKAFLRFIDARNVEDYEKSSKSALLLDPDTGIHAKKSRKHTTVAEIVKLMGQHTIVFVFDQSFSYGPKSHEPLLAKLRSLRDSARTVSTTIRTRVFCFALCRNGNLISFARP